MVKTGTEILTIGKVEASMISFVTAYTVVLGASANQGNTYLAGPTEYLCHSCIKCLER